MSVLVCTLLAIAVLSALLATIAFARMTTPLERLHPGGFVAVVSGGAIVGAGFATVGVTGQSIKMLLIVIVMGLSGALANHAIGRALHLRGGERR